MTATITARLLAKHLLATTALLALAACASGGGGGADGDVPTPVIDPVVGTVAAPRNLVLEPTSFRSGNEGRAVSETYDVAVRTLLVDVAENGARTFAENAATDFGTAQSMRYDAATNQFTVAIDYETDAGTRIAMSDTFGPLLLLTPKELRDLDNGLDAVYMATQTHRYLADPDYIDGNVFTADTFISALRAANGEFSGPGNLAQWRSTASDVGSEDDLGSLPVLVAQDPARFGAPAGVRGDLEDAAAYLGDLDASGLSEVRSRVPSFGAAQDAYLAELITFAPNAFGVSDRAVSNGLSGADLIEAMNQAGGVQIRRLLEQFDTATQRIEAGPGFFYTGDDGVQLYQYRIDGGVAPTRFVASAEWIQTDDEGREQYGHFVYGQRTDAAEMPDTGTATYKGTIYGHLQRQNTVEALRGGFDMETDFATGEGKVFMDADIAYNDGNGVTRFIDYAEFDGTASIDGAEFSGTMIGTVDRDVEDGTDVLEGSFEGDFFGPTAQEIGGTFEFSGQDAAAAGAFVGVDPNSIDAGVTGE